MVALNARKNIRGTDGDEPTTISLSDIQNGSLTANSKVDLIYTFCSEPFSYHDMQRPSNIAIMVDTTREYMQDQDSS
jgi:hypothetical protein